MCAAIQAELRKLNYSLQSQSRNDTKNTGPGRKAATENSYTIPQCTVHSTFSILGEHHGSEPTLVVSLFNSCGDLGVTGSEPQAAVAAF